MPAKMFHGNRPVAAILPIANTITPPTPSRIAFDMEVSLGRLARPRFVVGRSPARTKLLDKSQ